MKYISTRGKASPLSFEDVVITGLASDGGLYVPETIPVFSWKDMETWKDLPYAELAKRIMLPFVGDCIPEDDLATIIDKSYANFRDKEITPLYPLSEERYVLELFHGPTLAFKDIALQFLGNLLDYLLEKRQENVVIVGATSGDTGSAAIEGCRACNHIELFMLHPLGRVSDVQRRQMTTVLSDNIHNLAIRTDFDGCQAMVKSMFAEPDFLGSKRLTAVNSINWARIMAQIVYYFYAAFKLDAPETTVSFSVPTGNFGDIFAGYMALRMGLPIDKLIVATNCNDILHRFFSKNDYSKAEVSPSLSPSMDIQVSSNFERLLFDLYDHDGAAIAALMDDFTKNGKLAVSETVLDEAQDIFGSYATDDAITKEIIRQTYDQYNYLIDPHTATAINAAHAYKHHMPMVILSTAHPSKFPKVTEDSLNVHPALPDHLYDLMEREERYTRLPDDLEQIKAYIKEHVS